jgi:hypothetical protein
MFNAAGRQVGGAGLGPGLCFLPCALGLRFDNGVGTGHFRGITNEPMAQERRRNHLRRRLVKTPEERPEASHFAPRLYSQPLIPVTCLSGPVLNRDRASD